MGAILFVVLLVVPLAELYVIVQVADRIGVLETVISLILISVVGAWLLKQQGMAAWMRFRRAMERGEIPAKEATDGALIITGGALLLTPGFLTDIVGLLLLFPATRAVVKRSASRLLGRWVKRRYVPAGVTVKSRRRVTTTAPESPSPSSPSSELPRPEDDSPDRA